MWAWRFGGGKEAVSVRRMAQCQFRFPSLAELDAYDQHKRTEPDWLPPALDASQVLDGPWWDAEEEALSRTAFVDPISVMITFLRLED